MVPRDLQRRVWATYRVGQCDDGNPSKAWHKAADAAIEYVFKKEFGVPLNRRKAKRGEEEMKLEMAIIAGPESKQFLVDFTKQLDRLENLSSTMRPVVPVGAASAEAEEETEESDDFAAKPVAAKTKKAAASTSFEEAEPEETPEEEAEEDFTAPPAKVAAKAKKLTTDDVNDACKAKAKAAGGSKAGRDVVLAILKKSFNVQSVTELKAEQYAACVKAMKV